MVYLRGSETGRRLPPNKVLRGSAIEKADAEILYASSRVHPLQTLVPLPGYISLAISCWTINREGFAICE